MSILRICQIFPEVKSLLSKTTLFSVYQDAISIRNLLLWKSVSNSMVRSTVNENDYTCKPCKGGSLVSKSTFKIFYMMFSWKNTFLWIIVDFLCPFSAISTFDLTRNALHYASALSAFSPFLKSSEYLYQDTHASILRTLFFNEKQKRNEKP